MITDSLYIPYLSSDLLSRAVTHQVSSALRSLTSVFGMGTGVTSASLPLSLTSEYFNIHSLYLSYYALAYLLLTLSFLGQALGLLVSLS